MQEKINSAKELIEFQAIQYGWLIIVIMFSATSKYISDLDTDDKPTFMGAFKAIMTSGFFGMVTAFLCYHQQVPIYMSLAMVALATHNGRLMFELGLKVIKDTTPKK